MVAGLAEVEDGIEVGCLAGGCQYGSDSPFESGYFGSYRVVGGVGEAGVEVSALFEVEKLCHLFRGGIFEGGALEDWEHAGLSVAGLPSPLHADRAEIMFLVHR